METKNVIYLYTNKINGNKYIGQTFDFKRRHQEHLRGKGIKDNSAIDLAIEKYGEENFDIKILLAVPNSHYNEVQDYLNEMEKYYIWKFDTFNDPDHYNLTEGGYGTGSRENSPRWKEEARIIKGGTNRNNEELYILKYKGKSIQKSIDKNKLERIKKEINEYGVYFPSKEDRAYVVKCGFIKNKKQLYGIKYKGELIKWSIFEKKLQRICDEINLYGVYDLQKEKKPHIVKIGFDRRGNQRYGIKYEGKIIQKSIFREKLQVICDDMNHKEIESSYEYQGAYVNTYGFYRGKQLFVLKFQGENIQKSVFPEKLQLKCANINYGLDISLPKKNSNKKKRKKPKKKTKKPIKKPKDAYIVKCGFETNNKQKYGIRYQGKIIQTSINYEKLEFMCKKINEHSDSNIDQELFNKEVNDFYKRISENYDLTPKNRAVIRKHGKSGDKQLYSLFFDGNRVKRSIYYDKLKIECDELNKKNPPSYELTHIRKKGYSKGDKNKPNYGLVFKDIVLKESIFLEDLEKLSEKINNKIKKYNLISLNS